MQKRETVTPEPRSHEEVVETTCDLCGAKTDGDPEDGSWSGSSYDRNFVVMRHREGTCYPESQDFEDTEFDVCPTCWRDKIVPFMESQGAKPRKEEISW